MPTGTTIHIPMGAPTGNVYVTEGIDFQITKNGKSGPAELLFDTESGAIEWRISRHAAEQERSNP